VVAPHVDYIFMYGTGFRTLPAASRIPSSRNWPGHPPDLGTHWALDYTPTFQFYSSDKFRDTMNQASR